MTLSPTTHFSVGQTIFQEGDVPDGVYLICTGVVEVSKLKDQKPVRLATLSEGAIFGEMSLIDNARRSATITAIEDTWCYQHNNKSFVEKLEKLDSEISDIFHDLVDTIRKKSEEAVIVDHGSINLSENFTPNSTRPSRSKAEILNNTVTQEKIAELDYFMRRLFYSLVDIAYK